MDTYGNHPSFCTMTLGNEYGGKDELLTRWVDMLIQRDPRHLYSSASSARRRPPTGSGPRSPHGPRHPRRRARSATCATSWPATRGPIIGHEIGQWMFFPDFNEMKKYTGVMAVKNFEMIRDDLEKKTPARPRAAVRAGQSASFAMLLYKEEIEVLLRTPGYAGFSLLDLHDYPTQGTALIGPLDPFWDSKGLHHAGSVPAVLRADRAAAADAQAHLHDRRDRSRRRRTSRTYGPADLAERKPVWTIKDEQGREVASGKLPAVTAPTGKLTALGAISASLAKPPRPAKLTVTVALPGTEFANDWDIWVYPAQRRAASRRRTWWSARSGSQAKAALAAGKKVVFFAAVGQHGAIHARPVPAGVLEPGLVPEPEAEHDGHALRPDSIRCSRSFPTEFHSNWQW